MKKRRIVNPFGVLLALLVIAVFYACKIKKDDPTPVQPTQEVGTVLWSYSDFNVNPEPTEPVAITAPAIGPDGTIYVASYDRVGGTWHNARVHAINPDSTYKWTSPELNGVDVVDPVVGADGSIYVIAYTTVYAINPIDGSFIWTFQPPADSNEQYPISWLTLGNDGQIFFAHIGSGIYARRIYALNSNGQLIWKKKVGWGASHLIVGVDGTLFASWDDSGKRIYAIDPSNGTTTWSKDIEGWLDMNNGVAISPDGNLVASQTYPDKLIKIDKTTGDFIWQVDALRGHPSISPDGSIYLLSSDLYCYNPNGSLKWQTGSQWGAWGAITIDSDGNAYVSMYDYGNGNFQVYKPDGSLKWAISQTMHGQFCVAIGSNHVIYISWPAFSSTSSAILYAIQGDKPLASSGWPRDTGGNKNSRNVNLH